MLDFIHPSERDRMLPSACVPVCGYLAAELSRGGDADGCVEARKDLGGAISTNDLQGSVTRYVTSGSSWKSRMTTRPVG